MANNLIEQVLTDILQRQAHNHPATIQSVNEGNPSFESKKVIIRLDLSA